MTNDEALAAQLAEIDARLAELHPEIAEIEAAILVRDLLYLAEEGFIRIDPNGLIFPVEGACRIDL